MVDLGPGGPVAFAVRGLTKRFGSHRALDGVTFEVAKGHVHALLGENGAGKSTLIKTLAGVHQPDEGEILVNGEPVELRSPRDSRQLGFGFLHQHLGLVGGLSVKENLVLGLGYPRRKTGRIDWGRIDDLGSEALRLVGLQVKLDRLVSELTPAEQQLVALARVMQEDPSVIVLDEPTASLGPEESEHLLELVNQRREAGHTILYISHRLDEILRIADRVTVLKDGSLVSSVDRAGLTRPSLVRLLGGAEGHARSPTPPRERPVRLEVINLASAKLEHPVSLKIGVGEVLALAGLVGSGRSTFAEMLTGGLRNSGGHMFLDGTPYSARNRRHAAELGVAYVPSDRSQALVPDFTIEANVTLGNLKAYTRSGFVIAKRKELREADRYIDTLSIRTSGAERRISSLSGGTQQKVLLARALDLKPRLLVLDEPTAGVDIGTKEQIYEIVRHLASTGVSVLVISSEFEELPLMADRIATFNRGRILGMLPNAVSRAEIVSTLFQEI